MEVVALVARVALAAVLVTSAVAKVRDREGARTAVRGFGVPASLVAPVAVALAPLELASAALLLTSGWGVTAGALLAALLLTAFTVAIVVNLARDNRIECHCFGALSTKPLSWWSVLRNVVLLALAALVLAGGTAQAWPWRAVADAFAPLSVAERWLWIVVLVLLAAVATLGFLFVSLLQRYGHVLLRLDALEAGGAGSASGAGHAHDFHPVPVPAVELIAASGATLTSTQMPAPDRASLFVFVSSWCEACGELVPDLQRWQADPDGPRVVVLSPGERDAVAAKFVDVDVHLHDGSAADTFGAEFTPGAVVVSSDGLVTTPPSYGADDVRRLYAAVSGRAPADIVIGPPPVREGDPVPDAFVTIAPGGQPPAAGAGASRPASSNGHQPAASQPMPLEEAIEATVGSDDAVLLFWDTSCGFCQQITADVARRVDRVPLVVVMRDDDLPALRASGITSPVLLDPPFAVGNAVQAPGTPSAVRVRNGALASTVAVGGPEVLNLLAAVRVTRS